MTNQRGEQRAAGGVNDSNPLGPTNTARAVIRCLMHGNWRGAVMRYRVWRASRGPVQF